MARQRPLLVPPLPSCGPCRGRALGGPPAGSGRGAGGRRARVTPWTGDPPLRAPGGSRGRRPGSAAPRAGVPAPRPSGESWRRRGRARSLARSGVARSLLSMVPPFPLPQVASGACGPRGGNRGPEPPSRRRRRRRRASRLREPVTGRGNFPKPEPEPEHPPPPPRPLIPLPLHRLRLLPLPPTRILPCLTDGAVSQ